MECEEELCNGDRFKGSPNNGHNNQNYPLMFINKKHGTAQTGLPTLISLAQKPFLSISQVSINTLPIVRRRNYLCSETQLTGTTCSKMFHFSLLNILHWWLLLFLFLLLCTTVPLGSTSQGIVIGDQPNITNIQQHTELGNSIVENSAERSVQTTMKEHHHHHHHAASDLLDSADKELDQTHRQHLSPPASSTGEEINENFNIFDTPSQREQQQQQYNTKHKYSNELLESSVVKVELTKNIIINNNNEKPTDLNNQISIETSTIEPDDAEEDATNLNVSTTTFNVFNSSSSSNANVDTASESSIESFTVPIEIKHIYDIQSSSSVATSRRTTFYSLVSPPPPTTTTTTAATTATKVPSPLTPPPSPHNSNATIGTKHTSTKHPQAPSFEFTKLRYNVTIPENSVLTYVSSYEKMGIYISDPAILIRYKIVGGDQEKIFKAETKHVGDFFFLMIRVRHGNKAVLNREYKSWYDLRVRATISSTRNKLFKLKSKCNVHVDVLDQNDISPTFFANIHEVDIAEDVPLDISVFQVEAIDNDAGRNGEVYYYLDDEANQYFAIHPTSGVIYTTRSLNLAQLWKRVPANVTAAAVLHQASLVRQQHGKFSNDEMEDFLFHLTVFAKDRGIHSSSEQILESSKTRVNVRVIPVNRNAPSISIKQHSTLSTSMSLSRPIYAVVQVSDPDLGKYGEICSFSIVSGNEEGLFTLTNATSSRYYNLEFSRPLAEITNMLYLMPLKLTVKATDCGGRSSNQTLTISPETELSLSFQFSSDNYFREVRESSPVGTQILQLDLKLMHGSGQHSRTQAPSVDISLFKFSIISGSQSGDFAVSRNGVLYNRVKLDRESKAKYTLVVRAEHESNRVATTMVHIEVTDVNDNYPVFRNGTFGEIVNVRVPENSGNGSVVYRAEATDADTGNNGMVTYQLLFFGHAQELPFSIDPFTGDIFTIRQLDYETLPRKYHVFVRASDWGEPYRLQSEVMLNITITDVNDHRPHFLKTNCTAYVPLNTKPYTEIITFAAVDLDENSVITYKMFTPEAERCFRLHEHSGQLELICNLKKEVNRQPKLSQTGFILSVSAFDRNYFSDPNSLKVVIQQPEPNQRLKTFGGGRGTREKRLISVECTVSSPIHHSHARLIDTEYKDLWLPEEMKEFDQLQLSVENNQPVIRDTVPSEISLPEDTQVGSKIITFTANDSDTSYEGLLLWSLNLHEGDNGGMVYFEVNAQTGELFLISKLDYEQRKILDLKVTVCDQGVRQQKCSHQIVVINVEDVNDNAPELGNFVFNISESAPLHSLVGVIRAKDADTQDNAMLEYLLDGPADVFTIDLFNGTIRLEKELDRETIDKYTLYVTVSDSGTPPLSSSAVITIYVDDTNDNKPEFFQKSYFVKVFEDIPVGTRLTRISAIDQDEGEAAEIRYTLQNNVENTFALDELTGNLRLIKSLDYEHIQLYNLTLIASDLGKPSLSSFVYLLIEIDDVDENRYAPKFSDIVTNATVKENQPKGTLVTQVTAIDEDDPKMSPIYQIVGGNGLGWFHISDDGKVFTSVVLDCETHSHFWLTIVAKDRAAVPRNSWLELYIEVEDLNDLPPLTIEAFYQTQVYENITLGSGIVKLKARDQNFRISKNNTEIQYRITNQVPFSIDQNGVITTNRVLDREFTPRYVIDVEVKEIGHLLVSRTPVIVDVKDVNEFEPKPSLQYFRCTTFTTVDMSVPVCQVVAFDRDSNTQCLFNYSLLEDDGDDEFRLNENGFFYPTKTYIKKGSYAYLVQISDCGGFNSTAHVIIRVYDPKKLAPTDVNQPPRIEVFDMVAVVYRADPVGKEVMYINSIDPDQDKLVTRIVAGNTDDTFALLDTGALVTAKSLHDCTISLFNLTFMVTDSVDNATLNTLISVHNNLDQVMPFTQDNYTVNVLENITIGSDVLQLNVIHDYDVYLKELHYSIYSVNLPDTQQKFEIDSISGKLKTKAPLDYESGKQHVLLIECRNNRARESGSYSRTFAKVIINVIDVNDQSPQFILNSFDAAVLESAAVGTLVLQVQAYDGDFGSNAMINYSLVSGNQNDVFNIDPTLGYIYLSKRLDLQQQSEYYLVVRATDQGQPPLSSVTNVHLMITMPDNSPPRFEQHSYFVDVAEDEKAGVVILSLRMASKQTIYFEINSGNTDQAFAINTNNGELYLRKQLDHEQLCNYSLTVSAVNQFGVRDRAHIFVSVLDVNDNAPYWKEHTFEGLVHENSERSTLVLTEEGLPLVVKAYDNDSTHNAFLKYAIVEKNAQEYFSIEPSTGAITLLKRLNYEQYPEFTFTVSVVDLGYQHLKAVTNAVVRIKCVPVNDCPPVFDLNKFYRTLLLPTYSNVIVGRVSATDCDLIPNNHHSSPLKFSISSASGNSLDKFCINATTGKISTTTSDYEVGVYELDVAVYDGKHTATAKVYINAKPLPQSSLRFEHNIYQTSIVENNADYQSLLKLDVRGATLGEPLLHRILNPTEHFSIGSTSGALFFKGIPVDREEISKFTLVIEVSSIWSKDRIAHTIVEITVQDVNDNRPIFVQQPYNFVYDAEAVVGTEINKVQAIDKDSGDNGRIRYWIAGGDNMDQFRFAINPRTGQLTVAHRMDEITEPSNYTLLIKAIDSGKPPLEAMTSVVLRRVTSEVPVFVQPSYNITVSEAHIPLVPILTLKAESPNGRQLFYHIEQGNENEEFTLDFNTDPAISANGPCILSIAEKLDRETINRYTLVVHAIDARTSVFASVNVYIDVEDTNDNPPMFSKLSYNASVVENLPVGSQILTVKATDPDVGLNSKLQYHIINGANQSMFYMSPDDGIIYLKAQLDYEKETVHHFTIQVTDYGSPQLTSTAQVWIEVLDINDNPPTLPPSFAINIDENTEKGSFVTKISANDADWSDRYNLRYHIISGGDNAFVMNKTSGAIFVRNLHLGMRYPHWTRLDQLPRHRTHYRLNVSVSDGIFSSTEQYDINVILTNHFSPKLNGRSYQMMLSEGLPVGEQVLRINATDYDEGIYGEVRYSILNELGMHYFSVDPHSGSIKIRTPLDYDKGHRFLWLALAAQDTGKRIDVADFRVAVIDENDNIPHFIVGEYRTSICSNRPNGSTVLAVRAADDDSYVENAIRYYIYEKKRNNTFTISANSTTANSSIVFNINDYFDIGPESGYLYIKKNISSLEGQTVQFFVRATNGDKFFMTEQSSRTGQIENVVPVSIQISNECKSVIKEAFLYEVFVLENNKPDAVLVNVNLEGYLEVELNLVGFADKTDRNRFRIDKFGRISVTDRLDHEANAKHMIAVQLKDKFTFEVNYFYVIINIMDENDCVPYFDSSSYHIEIAENQEIGSTIFKVIAYDNDINDVGQLRYSLNNSFDDTFKLDETHGWVVLNKALNREMVPSYQLVVWVTDSIHHNWTTLRVDVADVNDNAPIFDRTEYIASVYENCPIGISVISVQATDIDLNSKLAYYIIDGDPLNQFIITSLGEVLVNKSLDREFIDRYELKILVTDSKYQSTTQLLIDILDVNDNGPICSKSNYVELVSEAVPPGTYILTVEATDQDELSNARLNYKLEGEHKDHFVIEPTTGRLSIKEKLDRESQSSYLFTAVVFDTDNHESCSSNIEIRLSDVNDQAPQFLTPPQLVHIPEDSPVGMILGKVTAIDHDIGYNRHIRYELSNPTGEFIINEKTGLIRLIRSLDRETQSMYNLTIMAFDNGVTQLNSSTYFVVNISDVNDNAPEFEMQSYESQLSEDAVIGTVVQKIFATSKDTGINAEIKYAIVAGNENDTFAIDAKSGVVTVQKALDYEQIKEYFLTVQAKDQGIPPLFSDVSLHVNVQDINDMAPQFVQRSYDIVIREDAALGDRILQLVAIDLDSSPNANLTYSFAGGAFSYKEFDIDPLKGILTVGRQLDRESISAYILEVSCCDNGQPTPLYSSVLVNVEISDYNDNAPQFDKINQTVSVQEGREIGFNLISFNIQDTDSALNSGPFKFHIVQGNEQDAFTMVDSDASLRTNSIFNHSFQSEYRLLIEVTDSGNPPLSTTNWVTVNVIQEPQHPPKLHPLTVTILSLDQFPGGIIGQVNASDENNFDRLTYSLINAQDRQLFSIESRDGTLFAYAGLDLGQYKLNVSVTNGKFVAYGIVEVEVLPITESMIGHAMVIEFNFVSVKDFVSFYMKNFARIMKNMLNVRAKDITIISVQPAERQSSTSRVSRASDETTLGDTSVMFVAANTHGGYFTRSWLKAKLSENKFRIESQLGLSFTEISLNSECVSIHCVHGDCHEVLVLSEQEITSIVAGKQSFVSPFHQYKFGCVCHTGFGGTLCNFTVNECARNPCPSHKECHPVTSSLGYVCQCPFGKSGENCNENADTCYSNERDVSLCYQEFNPLSFSGNSYVRYGYVKKIDKILLRFRTYQTRARIFGQQGDNGFQALEIAGGYIQYRFDCGEGEGLVRIHPVAVNDGRWHEIVTERQGNQVSLLLDQKSRAAGFAPGNSANCLHEKNDIFFGSEVKLISGNDNVGEETVLNGLVGCLDKVLINGQQIPLHSTSTSSVVTLKTVANVEFACNFKSNIGACRTQPCQNGATCNDLANNTYSCICLEPRYTGRNCEIDTKPCESAPCLNGGVCVANEAACQAGQINCYLCECSSGFTGVNCQHSRYCTPNICQNNGVCEETALGPRCYCHSGWHGLYCQDDIDECQLNTPACLAPASCVNLPGTFRCTCPLNITTECNDEGFLAGNVITSKFPLSSQDIIRLIIIMVAVIVVSCCTLCCWSCCNRRRKTRAPKKNDANQALLKRAQANTIYDQLGNGNYNRGSKTSNIEMNTVTSNSIVLGPQNSPTPSQQNSNLSQQQQQQQSLLPRSSSYSEQASTSFEHTAGATMSEEYILQYITQQEQKQAKLSKLSNKKEPPVASVSPQFFDQMRRSPKNLFKFATKRCSSNDVRKSTPPSRVSRESDNSTVFADEPCTSLAAMNTEGYHWDNSDLQIDDGVPSTSAQHQSHLVEFPDNIRKSHNPVDLSLEPESESTSDLHSQTSQSRSNFLFGFLSKNKNKQSKTNTKQVDPLITNEEVSPLLKHTDVSVKANNNIGVGNGGPKAVPPPIVPQLDKHNNDSTESSPSLGTSELRAKMDPARNFIEFYLPKHDTEDWNRIDGVGNNCNSPPHNQMSPMSSVLTRNRDVDCSVQQHQPHLNGNPLQQPQQSKPMKMLTFKRNSLHESVDNYSLMSPSPSCSTSPPNALATSSSNEQCSLSMSSSLNTDFKIPLPASSLSLATTTSVATPINSTNGFNGNNNNNTNNGYSNHNNNNNNNNLYQNVGVNRMISFECSTVPKPSLITEDNGNGQVETKVMVPKSASSKSLPADAINSNCIDTNSQQQYNKLSSTHTTTFV